MKNIHYKGVKVELPDGLSLNLLKRLVDTVGGDYSMTVQDVINFIADNQKSIGRQTCDTSEISRTNLFARAKQQVN